MAADLTQQEVRSLADTWFSGLNEHRPMVRMLPLLAEDGLRMVFPESTLTTLEEFETWYRTVTGTFFDQDHIIRSFSADIHGSEADVRVSVIWKASQWVPPAAFSTRSAMVAEQTWRVRRSAGTNACVISLYSVDSLTPLEADEVELRA
jgi:hypothetical protein